MKKILILGGGGFIGGHLAKRLKSEGNWVRIVDLKEHEYFSKEEICDEFIVGDLRDPQLVSRVMYSPKQTSTNDFESISLPLVSNGTYSFFVDWGDGNNDIITSWKSYCFK